MVNELTITLVGGIGLAPTMRTTKNGTRFIHFKVAHNEIRYVDGVRKSSPAWWFSCQYWERYPDDPYLDFLAETLKVGQTLIMQGRLNQQKLTNEDGQPRFRTSLVVRDIGIVPKLRDEDSAHEHDSSGRYHDDSTPQGGIRSGYGLNDRLDHDDDDDEDDFPENPAPQNSVEQSTAGRATPATPRTNNAGHDAEHNTHANTTGTTGGGVTEMREANPGETRSALTSDTAKNPPESATEDAPKPVAADFLD